MNLIKNTARFGIEVECYGVSDGDADRIADEFSMVNVHDDGSIRGSGAQEFTIGPLPYAQDSFNTIARILKRIRDAGGQVNRSCGLHVHIEVPKQVHQERIHASFFKNLLRRYAALENDLDLLVPSSRRSNNNTFCNSVNRLFQVRTEIENSIEAFFNGNSNMNWETLGNNHERHYREIDNLTMSMSNLYSFSDFGRYYKVNITSFIRHGTVEFRHHGGSLNTTKVLAWIRLCYAFVEFAYRQSSTNHRTPSPNAYNNIFTFIHHPGSKAFLQGRLEAARAAISPTEQQASV